MKDFRKKLFGLFEGSSAIEGSPAIKGSSAKACLFIHELFGLWDAQGGQNSGFLDGSLLVRALDVN